jgi:hypothetical protein
MAKDPVRVLVTGAAGILFASTSYFLIINSGFVSKLCLCFVLSLFYSDMLSDQI